MINNRSQQTRFWLRYNFFGFILLIWLSSAYPQSFRKYFIKEGAVTSSPSELAFGTSVAVDAKQQLLISDCSSHNVFIYDKNGKYLQTLGSHGKGPGEFECPYGVQVDRNGDIVVCDNGLRRLVRFDEKRAFKKSILVTGSHFMAKEFCFLPDNSIILAGYMEDFAHPMTGTSLQLYSAEGKHLYSFMPVPEHTFKTPLAYYSTAHIDVDSLRIIYAVSESDCMVHVFSSAGELLRTFSVKNSNYVKPPRYPDADRLFGMKIKERTVLDHSWTPFQRLIVHQDVIVTSMAKWNSGDDEATYYINIHRKDGTLIESDLSTPYKLLCKDHKGIFYFLEGKTEDVDKPLQLAIGKYILRTAR